MPGKNEIDGIPMLTQENFNKWAASFPPIEVQENEQPVAAKKERVWNMTGVGSGTEAAELLMRKYSWEQCRIPI